MNPILPVATARAAVRRLALPVLSAWLLRIGILFAIIPVRDVVASRLTGIVNFILRRGFPDVFEIPTYDPKWQISAISLFGGVVAIGLGLLAGLWASVRNHSRTQKKPSP